MSDLDPRALAAVADAYRRACAARGPAVAWHEASDVAARWVRSLPAHSRAPWEYARAVAGSP